MPAPRPTCVRGKATAACAGRGDARRSRAPAPARGVAQGEVLGVAYPLEAQAEALLAQAKALKEQAKK